MDKLTDAISNSHDTAVGPVDVHYQMLKHLPNDALLTLLNIFNNIGASGKFPASWGDISGEMMGCDHPSCVPVGRLVGELWHFEYISNMAAVCHFEF